MRNITLIVLVFISTCCFAIDQKLIDGAKKYDIAAANVSRIINAMSATDMPIGEWIKENNKITDPNLPESERELARKKIDDAHEKFNDLNMQLVAAEELVKKLEPMKNEYDKQRAKEERIKDTMWEIAGFLIIPGIFALVLWLAIRYQKKLKRLLKEGKISQEEYDRMTQNHESHAFNDDEGINPATGLPLVGVGISDVGGNIRGSSSNYSSTSSSYQSRNCWDRWN